jgi:xeroderma pigmentosum group C-complementing protein
VAEEKARAKREERVIKQWTRLIQGLRIRQRLREQYGTKSDQAHADEEGKGKTEQKRVVDGENIKPEAGKNGLLQAEAEEVYINFMICQI